MTERNKTISDLIKLSKQSSKYCVGMEGNVSCKINDTFFIKASGSKLNELSLDDLVNFDFNGNQINNFDKKGSMELGFHTFLLGFDDVNFISHTHPTNTLKILCSNLSKEFADKRIFPDQVIFNGKKSCLVPYSTPGNELTLSVKNCVNFFIKNELTFPKLILLENHGIISCGKSIDECVIINEICEKSAEIFLGSKSLGSLNFLSDIEINKLLMDKKEIYRKSLL
jgi:ribulose-5-phosphate 4-epimerase/fuculose-1-phosphate aldolase